MITFGDALFSSGLNQLVWRNVGNNAVAEFKELEPQLKEAWDKQSGGLLEAMNLVPGHYPGGIPNNPSPLKSMLVSGLAGGALGYGAGMIGEKVLPDTWDKSRLRWTLAMLGAGMGAAPGAAWGGMNLANKLPFDDNQFANGQGALRPPEPDYLKMSAALREYSQQQGVDTVAQCDRFAMLGKELFDKAASFGMTGIGTPPVPVDTFNRVLWTDPRVGGQLSPAIRGAATGLMTAAANLPGKLQTRFVTPFDVGRIAAGMGSGYLSGAIVGKGLGLLMGMPEETQEKLKNTGMFAGIVANLVPMAFGA